MPHDSIAFYKILARSIKLYGILLDATEVVYFRTQFFMGGDVETRAEETETRDRRPGSRDQRLETRS